MAEVEEEEMAEVVGLVQERMEEKVAEAVTDPVDGAPGGTDSVVGATLVGAAEPGPVETLEAANLV